MSAPSVLVLACGALARELNALLKVNDLTNAKVECLPAALHNRPELIPGLLRKRLVEVQGSYDQVLVGYADCGTGGEIDRVCTEFDVERLPGSHCYEFYLPAGAFEVLHYDAPGTFYLTDYLATHFERLVIDGLGIAEHPELFDAYFGNYQKVVFISQTGEAKESAAAASAATRLKLPLEIVEAGWGQLGVSVAALSSEKNIAADEASTPVMVSR